MPVWAQVVLGVIAGGVLMLAILYFGIRFAIRRFLNKLKGALESAMAGHVPVRIHLEKDEAIEWKDASARQRAVDGLTAAGFTNLGAYSIEEMPMVRLQGFLSTDATAYAVLWEHDTVGTWVDLVCDYDNGTSLNYTNCKNHQLQQREGHRKVFLTELDARSLAEAFFRERLQEGLKPVDAAGFVTHVEESYADEIDWRNAQGGPTREEVARIAAASGQPVSEEKLDATLEFQRQHAMMGLKEGLTDRYLRTLAPEERERLEEADLVVIHDKMLDSLLKDEMESLSEEGAQIRLDGLPPRQSFARFNEGQPESRRCAKLGEIDVPLEADIYLVPEGARRTVG